MGNMNLNAVTANKLHLNGNGFPAFTQRVAKQIAQYEPFGWYVARFANGWTIGEMGLKVPLERYPLLNEDREPIIFPTVEQALRFLREECLIFSVAVYHR